MPVNGIMVRFRVYAPNGDPLGVLPHPLSWEAGLPFNDMSSLTMTYPDGSDAADLLKEPCEVALELCNPKTGVFAEYPGCRFMNIRRSVDMGTRPRILSFTMPSYGWQLKKVRYIKVDNPNRQKDGRIAYAALGPVARPVIDLLNEAKARDNIPGLTWTFTTTTDSAGVGWGVNISKATFDFGQDAWSILDTFSKQGLFDWRLNKRELQLFKVDTAMRRMLDSDTGVHVHSRLATTEEPVERTWEELAGRIVALGDNNVSIQREASDSIVFPWGKWDETFNASGVASRDTLGAMADRLLKTKYKSRTQYTKKLVWTEGAPVPLAEYAPGDFIRAMGDDGSQKASMRVYQITLSGTDPYGIAISLTLNDRFTDRALQTERWVNRSSGGGGPVGGGGTGGGSTKPLPPPVDSTPPKAPKLNSVTNEPYFGELGDPLSMADVAFTVVTEDINDSEIDVVRYNVSARRADFNWQQARTVIVPQPDSPSTGQVIHGKVPLLDSGYSYEFRVQAIRQSGYPSAWSNGVSQTMAYPADPLEIPSKPVLSSKLSTVKAEWDGRDATGAPYPAQFREIQVEVSANSSPWVHVGDIFSPGSSIIMSGKGGIPTWDVGDTVYVRFRTRNSASVISEVSETSSVTVVGVTGPDVAVNTLTANNVVAGTLTAEQIKTHSLSVDRLAIGDVSNMVADPQFYDTAVLTPYRIEEANKTVTNGDEWTVSGNAATLTLGSANKVSGWFALHNHNNPMPSVSLAVTLPNPGFTTPITRPANASGGSGAIKGRMRVVVGGTAIPGGGTLSVGLAARTYNRAGVQLDNLLIISTSDFTAAGDRVIESTFGLSPSVGSIGMVPYVWITSSGAMAAGTTVSISEFEIWQENSVFIGDGMVKSPLVAANAVTTDKLDADAITAKHSIRSAYYEMVSQSSASIIKITENANYSGQAGIRWDGLTNYGPRIFQVDATGTGGWDPRGFVITGPEQTVNSSGRVDLQFAYGITGSKIARAYGSETISTQGIWWDTSVARFRIGGMFNTTHYTNDMFRLGRLGYQNGTNSYGIVTSRRYYPILTPNGGGTPVTSSIYSFPSGTEGGFRYVSSSGTEEVFYLAACGTP